MKPLLFCLAPAGGSSSFFAHWQAAMGDALDVIPLDYPGRGTRKCEAAVGSLDQLVDDLATEVARVKTGAPFSILGHSMGATLAWELARHLEAGGTGPQWLFLSSRDAPSFAKVQVDHRSDDATLCRALSELGALPTSWLVQPRFLKPYLTALRSDLALLEMHDASSMSGRQPSCDAFVLYGKHDAAVTTAGLQDWSSFVAGTCELRAFEGGHHYPESSLRALAEFLATTVVTR